MLQMVVKYEESGMTIFFSVRSCFTISKKMYMVRVITRIQLGSQS